MVGLRQSLIAAASAALLLAPAVGARPASPANPPPVNAQAFFVWSGVDGAVLAARAAGERRPIASITKLMTVLVALDHLSLGEEVSIPPAVTRVGEATINLEPEERVTVRELVEGALIPSANDAATALALAASNGSLPRFVTWMNEEAAELGLTDTHFVNPHGLDVKGHYSSARDVVTLLRAALANPTIHRYAATQRAEIAGRGTFTTTDDLLARYPPLVAGKTGHTSGAGWSEVAEARAGGVTVVASVLGEPSRETRNADLQSLLAWGLVQYRHVWAIDTARVYARPLAPYGRPAVPLVAARSVVRLQRVGVPLVERVVAPVEVALPVRAGQVLGQVRVYERGRVVARAALLAARSERRPGLLGRARWYATRTLHHLGSLAP
jgi:serine-type D-Ala-D-Ala carboxypeptidase (penicillin-binding protein 5/6)